MRPRPVIIIRGLFPLLTQRLRSVFNVRVWLDPEDSLKYHWKLQRDVAQRGYVVEQVIGQIIRRQDDFRQFILPQARHADIIVRFMTAPGYFERRRAGTADETLPVRLIQRPTLPPIDLSTVMASDDALNKELAQFEEAYSRRSGDDLGTRRRNLAETAGRLEDRLWRHMESHRDLRPPTIGTFLENGRTQRRSHPLAIAQLLLALPRRRGARPVSDGRSGRMIANVDFELLVAPALLEATEAAAAAAHRLSAAEIKSGSIKLRSTRCATVSRRAVRRYRRNRRRRKG